MEKGQDYSKIRVSKKLKGCEIIGCAKIRGAKIKGMKFKGARILMGIRYARLCMFLGTILRKVCVKFQPNNYANLCHAHH